MKEETSTLGNTISPLTDQYVVLQKKQWDTWQLPPVHCEGYVNYPTALKIHDLQVFHVSEFSDNWKFYLVPLSTNQVLKVLTPHLIKQSLLNIIKYLMIHNHHYKQSDCCAKFLNRDVLRGYQVWDLDLPIPKSSRLSPCLNRRFRLPMLLSTLDAIAVSCCKPITIFPLKINQNSSRIQKKV